VRLPIASDVPGATAFSLPEPVKWIFAVGMDLKTVFVLNSSVALLPTVILPVYALLSRKLLLASEPETEKSPIGDLSPNVR